MPASDQATTSYNVYYGEKRTKAKAKAPKIPTVPTNSIPIHHLATLGQVTERTARRWKAADRVSTGYAAIVALKLHGDLGVIDPAWKGFRLRKGHLITPEGYDWPPGHIRAMQPVYELIRAQRVEIQRLRDALRTGGHP